MMEPRRLKLREAAVAGAIGSGLEWYNFTLLGFFATQIGQLFFPVGNATASLLLTFGTFAAGFLVRPFGGVLLSVYSDTHGRKRAMTLTMALMCAGTGLIAIAPTYDSIGLAAPVLVVVARLLQGLSTGGEVGNATAFLKDYAPPGRRAFYISMIYAGAGLFVALGVGVAALTASIFGHATLLAWGWRVPFLIGLLIGPVGLYLRDRVPEPPAMRRSEEAGGTPLRDVLTRYPRQTVAAGCLIALSTICTYVIHVYTPTYASHVLHLPPAVGYRATLGGNLIDAVLTPVFGLVADRVGTRPVLRTSALAMFVLAPPLFLLVTGAPSFGSLLLYQGTFGIITGAYHGGVLAAIDELLPGRALATGLSLADNIVVMVFGGSAAFVITSLIAATGSRMIPVGYLMLGAVLGFAGTLVRPAERSDQASSDVGAVGRGNLAAEPRRAV